MSTIAAILILAIDPFPGPPPLRTVADLQSGPAPSAHPSAPWPDATNTGADPTKITSVIAPQGGWYRSSADDLTIANTEVDGGIYWDGHGTLTLQNDIIKPDGNVNFAGVVASNHGTAVRLTDTTISGRNVGAQDGYPTGLDGDNITAVRVNISNTCAGLNYGTGSGSVTDSFLHDLGTGDGSRCHAEALMFQAAGTGNIVIRHNALDLAPGRAVVPGQTAAIFLQGIYGRIPPIIIDGNYLHGGYAPVAIAQGAFGVTGPIITNNCIAWPPGGGPLSDPTGSVTVWSGNTVCDPNGNDSGQPVGSGGTSLGGSSAPTVGEGATAPVVGVGGSGPTVAFGGAVADPTSAVPIGAPTLRVPRLALPAGSGGP